MNLRGPGRSARRRSVIALVSGLCVLVALVGFWTLRAGLAAAGQAQIAQGAVRIAQANSQDCSKLAIDVEQSCSATNKKPLASAGIKRDRPPTRYSLPPQWSLPTLASLTSVRYRTGVPNSHAPANSHDGQDLLTKLCVARR